MIETVDLLGVEAGGAGGDGVVWSTSPGFHANLVVLGAGGAVGAHRNDEVDVLLVVLTGRAQLDVDGERLELGAGAAAVVPKGAERSVRALGDRGELRYLSVHGQRRPMTIGGRRGGFGENSRL